MNIQSIKERFGIIGNVDALNRALNVAIQVAPTDISVLITGFKLITHSILPCFFPTAGANLLTKLKKDFTDNGWINHIKNTRIKIRTTRNNI